jgi:hypothetical protein
VGTIGDLDEFTRVRFEWWPTVSVSSGSVFLQLMRKEQNWNRLSTWNMVTPP